MFCFENCIFECLGFELHEYQSASDESTELAHEPISAVRHFLVLVCTDTSVSLRILSD